MKFERSYLTNQPTPLLSFVFSTATTWSNCDLLDVVYTIAFSLMLLHTDAHNKNVRYKMSKDQYVRQAKSIDGVNTIPADILEVQSIDVGFHIYDRDCSFVHSN